MITMDKQYETSDGCNVRIYCVDGGLYEPVHGAVQDQDGNWSPWGWNSDGRLLTFRPSHLDLVEKAK